MFLAILTVISVNAGVTNNIQTVLREINNPKQVEKTVETNGAGIVNEISVIRKSAKRRAESLEKYEEDMAENIERVSIPVDKDEANKTLMLTPYHNCLFVGKERRMILEVAELYVGKIGYRWGAKADENNNIGENLDCSGFTQFIFKDVLDTDIGMGTFIQCQQSREIKKEELCPGDLGFRYKWTDVVIKDEYGNPVLDENGNEQTRINHVGIYYGKDDEGNDLWIHCSSAYNGVAISPVDFSYFTTPFS